MTLRRLEEAQQRYDAEKAVDDPACMVAHLLDGDAIHGAVVALDDKHRVVEKANRVSRPRMVLETDDPVALPTGKHLWWTATAHDKRWKVISAQPRGAGSQIVVQLTTKFSSERLPQLGNPVTLSVLSTSVGSSTPPTGRCRRPSPGSPASAPSSTASHPPPPATSAGTPDPVLDGWDILERVFRLLEPHQVAA